MNERNSFGRPIDLIDVQKDVIGAKAKIGTLKDCRVYYENNYTR